jgi:hypothetical protein
LLTKKIDMILFSHRMQLSRRIKESNMTPQSLLKETLQGIDLPRKEIQVYGSQIVVTSYCQDSAEKWAYVIGKFAKIKHSAFKTIDKATTTRGYITVYRTFATI